jgi:hypothetical protein
MREHTPAECQAWYEIEEAERAWLEAGARLEAARQRFIDVSRDSSAHARRRANLRLVTADEQQLRP